ncbi:stage II sporulation protein P [Clostridium sp. LP20]|uniref:stage II sporulation protein P n=1 Tax=Clostridium sp. LP20 TaxID=3418665 RepID=UPI003EE48C4E
MYNKSVKIRKHPKINIGLIIFIIAIVFISFKTVKVLRSTNERGSLPYVQLLNIGMPIVENQIYDPDNFAENRVSLKTVLLEVFGLSNFNSFFIVNNELSFFNQNFTVDTNSSILKIDPFNLSDNSITKIDTDNIADETLKKALNSTKPEVLIYHTHTTEGFAGGGTDTTDDNYNIVGVGNTLAKELEEVYGISVVHDKTNHSVSYNESYSRSYPTLKSYVDKYKDFKLVIDLHRDSANSKAASTVSVNGVNAGKISFVSSKGSPFYNENKAIREEMIEKSKALFPGILNRTTEFNHGLCEPHQSIIKNSLLIECGSQLNTPEEAKETAKIIARLIAEELNKK